MAIITAAPRDVILESTVAGPTPAGPSSAGGVPGQQWSIDVSGTKSVVITVSGGAATNPDGVIDNAELRLPASALRAAFNGNGLFLRIDPLNEGLTPRQPGAPQPVPTPPAKVLGVAVDLAIPAGSSPQQSAHYIGRFLADSPIGAGLKIIVSGNTVAVSPGARGSFLSPLSALPPALKVQSDAVSDVKKPSAKTKVDFSRPLAPQVMQSLQGPAIEVLEALDAAKAFDPTSQGVFATLYGLARRPNEASLSLNETNHNYVRILGRALGHENLSADSQTIEADGFLHFHWGTYRTVQTFSLVSGPWVGASVNVGFTPTPDKNGRATRYGSYEFLVQAPYTKSQSYSRDHLDKFVVRTSPEGADITLEHRDGTCNACHEGNVIFDLKPWRRVNQTRALFAPAVDQFDARVPLTTPSRMDEQLNQVAARLGALDWASEGGLQLPYAFRADLVRVLLNTNRTLEAQQQQQQQEFQLRQLELLRRSNPNLSIPAANTNPPTAASPSAADLFDRRWQNDKGAWKFAQSKNAPGMKRLTDVKYGEVIEGSSTSDPLIPSGYRAPSGTDPQALFKEGLKRAPMLLGSDRVTSVTDALGFLFGFGAGEEASSIMPSQQSLQFQVASLGRRLEVLIRADRIDAFLNSKALGSVLTTHWPPTAQDLFDAAEQFKADPSPADPAALDAALAQQRHGHETAKANPNGPVITDPTQAVETVCYPCHAPTGKVALVPTLTEPRSANYAARNPATLVMLGVMPPALTLPPETRSAVVEWFIAHPTGLSSAPEKGR